MASTEFTNGTVIAPSWLNDVDDATYRWVSPTDTQFGGIVAGSWHTAINAAATYAAANGINLRLLPQSGGYPITDTVTIPSNVSFDMRGTYINWIGALSGVAVRIGTPGTFTLYQHYLGLDVRNGASTAAWVSPATAWPVGFIGLQLYELNHCSIEIMDVQTFTNGVELVSGSKICSYNRIKLGNLSNNKYALTLRTEGVDTGTQFVNQNTFWGGELQCSSLSSNWGSAYGVVFSYDIANNSYRGQNTNTFNCPSFELGSSTPYLRVPVYHVGAGSNNQFLFCRHESNDGPFALIDSLNTTALTANYYKMAFDNSVAQNFQAISQINGSIGNHYESGFREQAFKETWNSGRIVELVTSSAANTPYLRGPLHWGVSGSGAFTRTVNNGNIKSGKDELQVPNGVAVGTFIDTTMIKTWVVRVSARTGFGGRLFFQCFDSTGAVLTNAGPNQPYVRCPSPLVYTASFGGLWQTSADNGNNLLVTFHADVQSARIMVGGGTNPCLLKSFGLIACMDKQDAAGASAQGAISVYSGLPGDATILSAAKPDTAGQHGSYPLGQSIGNSAAAVGQPSHWTAITNAVGYLGKTWAINTNYLYTGEIVINGTNAYILKTAGTSAGAGGPTGTGTAIADNTCVWDYIGPKAVFATSGNLV